MMLLQRLPAPHARVLGTLMAMSLFVTLPAFAQTLTGSFGMLGGSSASASANLLGESSVNAGLGRASDATGSTNLFSGFVGQIEDPRLTASFMTASSPTAAQTSYQMIAVPLTASGGNLVSSLFEELGAANKDDSKNELWRIGHYLPATGHYADLAFADPVVVGSGYWIATKSAKQIAYVGLPKDLKEFAIPLVDSSFSGAWNQVGNPFPFPVAAQNLDYSNGGTRGRVIDPNSFVESTVYVHVGNTANYVVLAATSTVGPYKGFWVKRKGGNSGSVNLIVKPIASAPTTAELASRPSGTSWAVTVQASQVGRSSDALTLGTAPVVASGRNAMCLLAAPAPPGDGLRLVAHHDDWGHDSGDYSQDVRPASDRLEFEFTLAGGAAPGEVTLAFKGYDLPATAVLRLLDRASGTTRDITPEGTTTVVASAQQRAYVLLVSQGTTPSSPTARYADGVRDASPNPFRQRTGLAFSLANAGDAVVDLFDLSGRRVRNVDMRGLSAGDHVWVWDGSNAAGEPQAPGIYLARWRAGSAKGVLRLVKVR